MWEPLEHGDFEPDLSNPLCATISRRHVRTLCPLSTFNLSQFLGDEDRLLDTADEKERSLLQQFRLAFEEKVLPFLLASCFTDEFRLARKALKQPINRIFL